MKKGFSFFLLSLLFITPGCKDSKEIVNEYNVVPITFFVFILIASFYLIYKISSSTFDRSSYHTGSNLFLQQYIDYNAW